MHMPLFKGHELDSIRSVYEVSTENVLVTFRQQYGPTQLKKLWDEFIESLGITPHCISWWSGAGRVGLLECENEEGANIYGQWVLDDETSLIGVFEVDSAELVNIRAGFDAQSVTDSAMRAIRIGESGGELE